MKQYSFIVGEEDEGMRVDKYLSNLVPELSRSYIQKQIDEHALLVNGLNNKKSSYNIVLDDCIVLNVPDSITPDIKPQNIPIEIVYEDEDVAIVNKPQGMVVHPSAGHFEDTLVNALLYHLEGRLSGINGVLRPGIVHRIDKDTSGLLIICKNDNSHNLIAQQLKEHTCNRIYHAIVHGDIEEDELTVNAPIGRDKNDRKKMCIDPKGKPSVTHVKVLERFCEYTYIECRLETGRTHQIRVHLSNLGHPLMGDLVYSNKKELINLSGQQLHAKTIGFLSPSYNEYLQFDSDLPNYFVKSLNFIRARFA